MARFPFVIRYGLIGLLLSLILHSLAFGLLWQGGRLLFSGQGKVLMLDVGRLSLPIAEQTSLAGAEEKAAPVPEIRHLEKTRWEQPHREKDVLASGGTPAAGAEKAGEAAVAGENPYIEETFQYIMRHVSRELVYPARARRMGWTGTATFSFVITKEGGVDNLILRESSGQPLLDAAAQEALLRAAPFPPPPVPARITLPIVFRLK